MISHSVYLNYKLFELFSNMEVQKGGGKSILIFVSAGDGTAVEAALHDDLPGVDDRRLSPLGATGIVLHKFLE